LTELETELEKAQIVRSDDKPHTSMEGTGNSLEMDSLQKSSLQKLARDKATSDNSKSKAA